MNQDLFTKIILVLYALNTGWYVSIGRYGNATYWFGAVILTTCATWFMR